VLDVGFLTRSEIDAGAYNLRAFARGDFNGDRIEDIVVTAMGDERGKGQQIRLLTGRGGGKFDVVAILPEQQEVPGELAAADFDGDGDLDIAVLFNIEARVDVWWNDGFGNFTKVAKQSLIAGTNGSGLTAGDLDGDGRAELSFAFSDGEVLHVYATDAQTGRFGASPKWVLSAGAGSDLGRITIADLDGDKFPELCACDFGTERNRIVIWKRDGNGGYTMSTIDGGGVGPLSLVATDVDRDSKIDLVVGNWTESSVSILRGRGGLAFGAPTKIALVGQPFHVTAGDVNGDDKPDIVASYWPGYTIAVLEGDGRGGFGPERQFCTSGMPTMASLGDLDGDGDVDVVASGTAAQHLSWFLGAGTAGISGAECHLTGRTSPRFVVSADFDGDGFADAMTSDVDAGLVTLMHGRADGRFTRGQEIAIGDRPGFLTKGDFDTDGRVDVVVAVGDGLRFVINRSTLDAGPAFEVFPKPTDPAISVGPGPFEVVVGRFNGDTTNDLAIADRDGNRVVLLAGQGGFSFKQLGSPIPVDGGPVGLVTGDFNRDGAEDLAVSRFDAAAVRVLLGDGTGGFQTGLDLPAGPNPNYLRSADFNEDGLTDIVVSNLGVDNQQVISNKLTLYLARMSGGQLSFDVREIVVGTGPTVLMAHDFDRDGHQDVLVSNYHSADLFVVFGDGTGGFARKRRFPGTFRAIAGDLGDVDGDRKLDVVVASDSDLIHGISVFLNTSVKFE